MATLPLGEAATTSVRRTHRGRLFRKYLLLILTLVTGALLAPGAISIYFTYQENKAALASLQHEKALAAASRIEQYIRQIEQQLAYAALPQLDASDIELRRMEFLKLLRQAPEVTDISQLDASGHEQIAVSRLGMDSINSGKDRLQEPAYRNARRGQTWFGPVYFRKETEPYMTMSLRSGGDKGPVTVAEVNLKFVWDVVSRIKIGDKGKAYVVDNHGFLVADPDIGLVLRKTDLSQLPHVAAAIAADKSGDPTMVSTDLAGTQVLTSVAPIESLKWNVFVEQPVSEVYAKLNASILRTGLLLLAIGARDSFGLGELAVILLLIDLAIVRVDDVPGPASGWSGRLILLARSNWPPSATFAGATLAVIGALQASLVLGLLAAVMFAVLQLAPLLDRQALSPGPDRPQSSLRWIGPVVSVACGIAPAMLLRMLRL